MAKCPNCGGELHPQENGLWKCAECGKLFRMKQKTPPESDMNAGAPQAQTPPASERNVIEPPVQTEPSAPADEAQTAEIEELKRRLAAMEKQQTEKTAGRGGAAAGAAAAKFAPVIEFLKKYGLKVVLPVALLVVAFVTLCACFMGLRGIYVNVNDPNEFISFTATDYEWYYNSILGETVDKGKWSKSGNTIDFVVNDEFFGEVEDPYEVTDFSWDGFTLLDAFGAETRYERVSLICYKDNISKVTVSFDLNGGSGDGGGEQKFNIGTVAAEPETPTREGYIFRGWYTTADSWKTGKGRSYRPGAREWKSATYYANWQSATQFEMYCEYFEDEVEPFYEGESLMDVFKRGFNEDGDASNDLFEGIYFCEGSENGWTIKPLESDIAPAHNVRLAPTDYLENFTIIVDGKLYVVKDDASEYSIPGIVTDIGGRAFSLCDNLTTITIGNGVTSIENEAFYGCGGLTSITIPDRVTSIGDGVFAYCRGLTSVIIGSGVTSIGQDAFRDCIGLTSITIPDDVTSIGDYAFMGCYKLIEVYNKSSLDITAGSGGYGSVGNYAKHVYTEEGGSWFSDTEDGFRFFYDGEIGYLVAYLGDETELTLPENFTAYDGTVVSEYQIYDYAFRGCDSLTSVTIGNSVTSIGDYAFYSCDSLTSVTIGNSVTSIGDGVFAYCRGLTSVIIGSGVTSIGQDAFRDCIGLTSVTIPDSMTSIGQEAFNGCSSLTSITIPDSVTIIGSDAFSGCTNLEEKEDGISYVDGWVIGFDDSVSSVGLREGTRGIADDVFSGRDGLTSITIPGSVTSIGERAFYECPGLTSVTIGSGVTSIGDYAFAGCSSLTSITIPDSVTSIGSGAFSNCTGLTSITIPDSVTSIGDSAFWGCNSLKYNQYDNALYLGNENNPYLVLIKTVNTRVTSCEINGSTRIIYSDAFSDCSALTSVTIPDSVTSIGDDAFFGCDSLTSVTIPDGVTSIGRYAFHGCSSLTSITIPDSVTSIGAGAFMFCGLTSVTIGNGVTSIGGNAFYGCSSLTSITIPDSVTSIEYGAFSGCSGLISVTFEVTTGWYRTSSSTATNGTSLASSSLANSATVAEWLTSTYCDYYWKRNV